MTRLPSEQEELIEEALSEILECSEQGLTKVEEVERVLDQKVQPGLLEELKKSGFVITDGGRILLKPQGTAVAHQVIRRKRLTERLLKDVLNVPDEVIDPTACQWEHILNREVTNSICTILGHPTHSPFDLPIPQGDCCKRDASSVTAVIFSLDKLAAGSKAKISYLLMKKNPELNRLLSMGLVPGSEIELIQRFPSYVIQVNESQLAFDEGIAECIFVQPV